MRFFTSPKDLNKWVLAQGNPDIAIQKIVDIIGQQDSLSVKDGCYAIFGANKKEEKDKDFSNEIEESEALFSVLAKYKITEMIKTSEVNLMKNKIEKFNNTDFPIREAQVTRPPSSPYTGREDDNKYVGTPWRRDRDAIYDFTHRNPDMLSFDDDPQRVYSGEALWRRYIMDKFYRDYKDEKGRVVGGYINDRFKVFHDLGGNQMELANGERTRKPRPHQYSIERRLEEARGNKTEDILPLRCASGDIKVIITGSEESPAKPSDIKYASSDENGYVEVPYMDAYNQENDKVAKAFIDILDMHEAGINDEDIILKISNHYSIPIVKAAYIKTLAYKKKEESKGILYACKTSKMNKTAGRVQLEAPAEFINKITGQPQAFNSDTVFQVEVGQDGKQVFIEDNGSQYTLPEGADPAFSNMDDIDATMNELEGIEEKPEGETVQTQEVTEPMTSAASNDFPIREV